MKFSINMDEVTKKKVWFASFKNPTPESLEYYLEEMASEGYKLEPLGNTGMFYFVFVKSQAEKCKFMVDKSNLPKALYFQTMIDKGWELMGQVMNCYIWRMEYEDKRPEDLSDRVIVNTHNKNMFIGFLFACIISIVAVAAFVVGTILLDKAGKGFQYMYIVEAVIVFPFIFYFGWACSKCFKAWRRGK